jgi:hypothetical protein
MEEFILGVGEYVTEDVLREQDGKTVPLRLDTDGPIIGEATLKYVEGEWALRADLTIDDPKVAELLKGTLPPMHIEQER